MTWVLHPGSRPNVNVIELKKKYPAHFQWCEKNPSDLFHSLGVDYNEINNGLLKTAPSDDYVMEGADAQMDRKIRELFTAPHIGMHGCVGYCISLLNMMGLDSYASKLAEVYEKHIDLKSVDIFCVAGLRALVLQKMRDGEFEMVTTAIPLALDGGLRQLKVVVCVILTAWEHGNQKTDTNICYSIILFLYVNTERSCLHQNIYRMI